MRAIFKIEEYLPDTNQIVVRFARLHASQPIECYRAIAISCDKLDLYDCESFVSSLMKKSGNEKVKRLEESEPIKNEAETISGKLDLQDLVGRVIEGKVDDYRRSSLNMNRVEL